MSIHDFNINEIEENINEISKKEAYLLYEKVLHIKKTLIEIYPQISKGIYQKKRSKANRKCEICNKSVTEGAWFRHIKSDKHLNNLKMKNEK